MANVPIYELSPNDYTAGQRVTTLNLASGVSATTTGTGYGVETIGTTKVLRANDAQSRYFTTGPGFSIPKHCLIRLVFWTPTYDGGRKPQWTPWWWFANSIPSLQFVDLGSWRYGEFGAPAYGRNEAFYDAQWHYAHVNLADVVHEIYVDGGDPVSSNYVENHTLPNELRFDPFALAVGSSTDVLPGAGPMVALWSLVANEDGSPITASQRGSYQTADGQLAALLNAGGTGGTGGGGTTPPAKKTSVKFAAPPSSSPITGYIVEHLYTGGRAVISEHPPSVAGTNVVTDPTAVGVRVYAVSDQGRSAPATAYL